MNPWQGLVSRESFWMCLQLQNLCRDCFQFGFLTKDGATCLFTQRAYSCERKCSKDSSKELYAKEDVLSHMSVACKVLGCLAPGILHHPSERPRRNTPAVTLNFEVWSAWHVVEKDVFRNVTVSMDLIIVNRYLEDEVPNQSETILEQLQQQAQRRQSLKTETIKRDGKDVLKTVEETTADLGNPRSNHVGTIQGDNSGAAVSDFKATKGKKRKLDLLNPPDISSVSKRAKAEEGTNNETNGKKHFKKKKGTVSGSSATGNNEAETTLEKNTTEPLLKGKKTRKKKKGAILGTNVTQDEKNEAVSTDDIEHGPIEDRFTIIEAVTQKKPDKAQKAVPDWMAEPIVISMNLKKKLKRVSEFPGLLPSLVALLKSNGIKRLFPVQTEVISYLFETFCKPWLKPRDLCVSAPTGSGKTLAYALPIIQALHGRIVCSIKALVVLPVVDLAIQVYNVFKTYCKGSGLQVGLAVGQMGLAAEQKSLVRLGYRRHHSLVDILVCTPGRLVDHINHTPGFSLKELRFLVIDEADRMVQQVKHNWLQHVERSINEGKLIKGIIPLVVAKMEELKRTPQKLLFSATLTRNPEKLKLLELFQPKLFTSVVSVDRLQDAAFEDADDVIEKYTMPKELTEFYVTCKQSLKPLVILHFLHNLKYRYLIIFTNSLESSHRLCLLLSAFGGITVQEFSSQLNIRGRRRILKQFSQGLVDAIVCSDVMARGMDVENVEYVVSYDLPPYLKTYIHRVGRTARAGRLGTAISLIQPHELPKFQTMMEEAKKPPLTDIKVVSRDLETLEDPYKAALSRVSETVAKEAKWRRKRK